MRVFIGIVFVLATSCINGRKIAEPTQTVLRQELERMAQIDQIAASHPLLLPEPYKNYTEEQWTRYKDSVYAAHQKQLASYVRQYGFLGYNEVGQDGAKCFWLMVQHCDKFPAFQRQVLKSMRKEVKKGNANAENYAFLYDRVKVNAGQKQLFGTQVDYLVQTTGRAIPKFGISDILHLHKRRADYGLLPIREYLNQMTILHYEMNKSHYEKKGILTPDLYP
ncbi:hypothetical protein SAMN05421780_104112 [Flexibacter flexilis DSM 6793]|uniref:Uncharacterized protein n=1 Tax=Flexibacter flexilis DSM 6793 TaxID=927664 RepID=A0A1I1I1F0_9BACT|nr:DUF6624 domain-containing protein [Flexibacter flexilis]SFC28048.1 hypothetical protein SAMN05421780_104112 [Flexibacter flexilis DSM 6793]